MTIVINKRDSLINITALNVDTGHIVSHTFTISLQIKLLILQKAFSHDIRYL